MGLIQLQNQFRTMLRARSREMAQLPALFRTTPLHGLFLSLSVFEMAIWASISLSNTPAWRFPERAIGPAVLAGKDPSGRLLIYSMALCIGLVLAIATLWLSHRWDRYLSNHLSLVYSVMQRHALSALAMAMSFVLFLGLISDLRRLALLLGLLATWFLWLVIWSTIAALSTNTVGRRSVLIDSSFQVCLFLIPALSWVAWMLWKKQPLSLTQHQIYWYWLTITGETTLVRILERFAQRATVLSLSRSILWSMAPLVLLLPGAILGNEVQWLRVPLGTSLSTVYRSMIAIVVGLAALFFLYAHYTRRLSSRWCHRLVSWWIFPNIILFLVFSIEHKHTITLETLDYLHHGNYVIPAQQLIDFGRLPFIDAWYARNLNDMLGGLLHALFSRRYDPLGALLWTGTTISGGFALIFYGIMAILLSPLGGLLCFLVLPISEFFSAYNAMAVFPCLFVPMLRKSPTATRLSIFWLATLCSFAWMASDGATAIPAAVILVVSLAVFLPAWRNRVPWVAFVCVFGTAAVVYGIALQLKGYSILETFRLIQAFAVVDALIGSYEQFHKGLSPYTLLQYGIFPLISIALALSALRRIQKTRCVSLTGAMLLFIALVSLFLFKRAFARHCLIEVIQSQYFAAAGVFLVLLLFGRNRRGAIAAFAAVSLVVAIWQQAWEPPVRSRVLFTPHEWSTIEERVIVNSSLKGKFSTIKAFFDNTLEPAQTFAELVNAHLLYALVRRPYAFFHHSVQILQSDPAQIVYIEQWKRRLRNKEVPLVITQMSGWWGSSLDEMPFGLSVYRLAEFLYQYYEPYMYLEGLEIWKQKDFTPSSPSQSATNVTPIHLPQARPYAGNHVAIEGSLFRATGPDPYIVGVLENPGEHLLPGKQYALRLVYRSSKPGAWSITPMRTKGNSFSGPTYDFIAKDTDQEQHTHLVLSDVFRKEDFADFRVDIPDDSTFEILDIIAYPGTRPEEFGARIDHTRQELNYKLLPYVWAKYDSKSSLAEKTVLCPLRNEPEVISNTHSTRLDIPAAIDKSTGNYLLLHVTGNEDTPVDVRVSDGSTSGLLHFRLKGKEAGEAYLVRISSLWVWYSQQPLQIEIATPSQSPIKISSASILKGD